VISDTRTIAGKELREILTTATGRGEARRRLPLRSVVLPIGLGILFGLQIAGGTGEPAVFFVGVMAMTTTIALVSDTIAGERERHTLETLLASPAADTAILRGKLLAVVGYAWAVALLELATIEVTSGALGHALGARPLAIVAALSLLDATLAAGFGVQFSLRAPTVRVSARRLGQVSFLIIVPVSAINVLAITDTNDSWYPAVLATAFVALIVVDLALLALAQARFRRGRLLLD
jgi:ABC-2 type transport system permease protein